MFLSIFCSTLHIYNKDKCVNLWARQKQIKAAILYKNFPGNKPNWIQGTYIWVDMLRCKCDKVFLFCFYTESVFSSLILESRTFFDCFPPNSEVFWTKTVSSNSIVLHAASTFGHHSFHIFTLFSSLCELLCLAFPFHIHQTNQTNSHRTATVYHKVLIMMAICWLQVQRQCAYEYQWCKWAMVG